MLRPTLDPQHADADAGRPRHPWRYSALQLTSNAEAAPAARGLSHALLSHLSGLSRPVLV